MRQQSSTSDQHGRQTPGSMFSHTLPKRQGLLIVYHQGELSSAKAPDRGVANHVFYDMIPAAVGRQKRLGRSRAVVDIEAQAHTAEMPKARRRPDINDAFQQAMELAESGRYKNIGEVQRALVAKHPKAVLPDHQHIRGLIDVACLRARKTRGWDR